MVPAGTLIVLGRAIHHPLLHFALLGAMLYAAAEALEAVTASEEDQPVVQVDAATLERLQSEAALTGASFESLLHGHIEEAMLIDQALRRGLDERDPVVRRRLIQNMRLAYPEAGDTALLRRARALDMPRRDELVRRRLLERMRAEAAESSRPAETTAAELPLAPRHAEPRLSVGHVFIAGRDPEAQQRARRIHRALRDGEADPTHAGDRHIAGRLLGDVAPSDLRRRLGDEVADMTVDAARGEWLGPVASAQGWHVLRVAASPSRVASDQHWEQRAARYLGHEQQQRRAQADVVAALRERYRVALPDMTTEEGVP